MLPNGIYYKKVEGGKKFHLVNREMSWLAFNERVLQEAENPEVPLMERIKFLSIFSSNLDEFFKVRVAGQRRLLDLDKNYQKTLMFNPEDVLESLQKTVLRLQTKFDVIFREQILPELDNQGVTILNEKNLNEEQSIYLKKIFKAQILPYLTPIMISTILHFPPLRDRYIYLAVKMFRSDNPIDHQYALVGLPTNILSRFWILPSSNGKKCVIMLDDIVRHNIKELFLIFDYDRVDAYTIKFTRDAELDIDNDVSESFLEKMAKSLKQRKKGAPVRFIYDSTIPVDLLHFLIRRINLQKSNILPGGRYHNFSDFMQFPDMGLKNLYYEALPPLPHPFLDSHRRIFDAISEKDIMVHHPYQSFDYVIRFIRESAIDPQVVSIKATLYRVATVSNVVNSLITAVGNGKQVTVLIELQARFDEEANIYWAKKLEEAGAKVMYGFPGTKTHCKMCVVTRNEAEGVKTYAHLSTGNYNGSTAKVYCDDGLFTADKRITTEAARLFKALENNNKKYVYNHLLVAPYYLRNKLAELIDAEILAAKKGIAAYIIIKVNNLVDVEMIKKLYEASEAGVKINLIVRGMCSLVPGVKGMSSNISLISIVDRFLEHSRVYIFCNRGSEKIYLSSADLMSRNLSNRVEMAFPILANDLKKEIRTMIDFQLMDNVKARQLSDPLDNRIPVRAENEPVLRGQYLTYQYFEKQVDKSSHENFVTINFTQH